MDDLSAFEYNDYSNYAERFGLPGVVLAYKLRTVQSDQVVIHEKRDLLQQVDENIPIIISLYTLFN